MGAAGAPSTAVVTLTITEAAYNLGPELSFDAAEAVSYTHLTLPTKA